MADNRYYSAKLKDPRWQKKRLEIFQRDGFKCQKCGDDAQTLHVHHKFYISSKEPWEYDNDALGTLCESCHQDEEVLKGKQKEFVNTFLKMGFFNSDFLYLSSIIEQSITSFGFQNFDWLLCRLAISEGVRNEVLTALKNEQARNQKSEPIEDSPY